MRNNNKAFTLIELLVVVLIIGILAAIALPQYQKAVKKAHAVQMIVFLKAAYQSEKVYNLATGKWPTSWDDVDNIPTPVREYYAGVWSYLEYSWGTCSLDDVDKAGGNISCANYKRGMRISLIPIGQYLLCNQMSKNPEESKALCQSLGFVKERNSYIIKL